MMPPIEPVAAGRVTLVDAIDHLLNRGAVLLGDATLSVAGVDLVYVGLNLLVSSVETMRQHGDWYDDGRALPAPPSAPAPESAAPIAGGATDLQGDLAVDLRVTPAPPADPAQPAYELLGLDQSGGEEATAERSIARLVLALVELLRQLVERQALRRLEGNGLTEAQVERMGQSLMELSEKMKELRTVFGLSEEDLAIDLGPLGRML